MLVWDLTGRRRFIARVVDGASRTTLAGTAVPSPDGRAVVYAGSVASGDNLRFLDVPLHLAYEGPRAVPCDASFRKGDEMGWFELGSTIIVFAPEGFSLADGISQGAVIKMGQPLLRLPV